MMKILTVCEVERERRDTLKECQSTKMKFGNTMQMTSCIFFKNARHSLK